MKVFLAFIRDLPPHTSHSQARAASHSFTSRMRPLLIHLALTSYATIAVTAAPASYYSLAPSGQHPAFKPLNPTQDGSVRTLMLWAFVEPQPEPNHANAVAINTQGLVMVTTQPSMQILSATSTAQTTSMTSVATSVLLTPASMKTFPLSQGPGLVKINPILPSSTKNIVVSIKSTPTMTSSQLHAGKPTQHKLFVVGGVILVLAVLTLTLYFLLDPRLWLKGGCYRKPKSKKLKLCPTPAWMRIPPPGERTCEKDRMIADEKIKEKIIKITSQNTRSKFSITSTDYSDYSNSSRESTTPSSSSSVKKHADGPIRPPRPPTADSPALSDSVYYAKENQVYFGPSEISLTYACDPDAIHVTDMDIQTMSAPRCSLYSTITQDGLLIPEPSSPVYHSPLLSPVEFFMLPPSLEDVGHSRTQSAPITGQSINDNEQTTKSAEASATLRSILKQTTIAFPKPVLHRRSRSASGWAYPRRTPRD